MEVYLVDGTYELFRAYFALPALESPAGQPVGAVHGLIQSLLRLIRENAVSHIGCAFDSVIPSFRNDLFPGYKTGEGTPPELLAQFGLAEQAVAALGVRVWPMVEFEADDAIATATAQLAREPSVERLVICSPDKDLTQLVEESRVVCFDRRRNEIIDEAGVIAKHGVPPASIPDLLALTGDAADGIPGLPRWGAKSSAAVLSRYGHLEAIPLAGPWDATVRGAAALQGILSREYENALLYRQLATLRRDVPLSGNALIPGNTPLSGDENGATLEAVHWRGAYRPEYENLCRDLGLGSLAALPHKWADKA